MCNQKYTSAILSSVAAFACSIMLYCTPVFGSTQDDFSMTAGVKGYAASGISETSLYSRYFVEAGYTGDFISLMPSLSCYRDYQVADGIGNYALIGFLQAGCGLSLYPWEFLDVDLEYYYSTGDRDYASHELTGGFVLNFEKSAAGMQYSRYDTNYSFDGADITIERSALLFEFNYYIRNDKSVDISFERRSDDYDSLEYNYSQNIIRAGISSIQGDSIIMLGGIFAGMDSADYSIFGADLGMSARIKGCVKLTLTGRISHYAAPLSVESSGSGGSQGSGTNPLLQPSSVGESYTEKSVSFGVAWVM